MQTDNPDFWNRLYSQDQFVFGRTANPYLKEKLKDQPRGKILLPAEGEGRNAVYCALEGWEVAAFDLSQVGKTKAQSLANQWGVKLHFQVANVQEVSYDQNKFDVLALLFAHFSFEQRRAYHRQLSTYLKPGGILILQGFARPLTSSPDIRFNPEELRIDFSGFDIQELSVVAKDLNEGLMLQGLTEVVNLFAIKR